MPECSVELVVAWLETHPEIEIVSWDRGSTYVDGATKGAPLATQVCDRWHLLKNLGEAVESLPHSSPCPPFRPSKPTSTVRAS
ncbi:transposase [Dictyobacter formicarum]|uniref:transposase n=1 Tax=Dictyobacter formicarum TaxID=2778368 RepID=UPI001916933A